MNEIENLFRKNFFGPKQIETAFGFYPSISQIPPIPFSLPQLKNAQQNNHVLVLHIDTFPNGKPLTIEVMSKMNTSVDKTENYDNDWCSEDAFYTQEVPRVGWRLYSDNILPNSVGKNGIEQIEVTIEYLTNTFFKEEGLPANYQKAMEEFNAKRPLMEEILKRSGDGEALEISEMLMINKLTRATPVEMVQYFEMQYKNTGNYFLYQSGKMFPSDVPIRTFRRCFRNTPVDVVNMEDIGIFICTCHIGFDDPIGILPSIGNYK